MDDDRRMTPVSWVYLPEALDRSVYDRLAVLEAGILSM